MDFSSILSYLSSMLEWFLGLGQKFISTFVVIVEDLSAWLLDQMLGIVVSVLSGITYVLPSTEWLSAMSGLPPEITQTLGAIGAGQAMAVVVAALGVRFLIQMIPLVRWGS